MKRISILVPQSGLLANIEGPRQLLTCVNDYFVGMGHEPLFEVKLVGLSRTVELNNGLYTIRLDSVIQDVLKTDLVIIPALNGDLQKGVEENREFVPWIISQYRRGAEVASLCVGAFLLASTGLLDGRSCVTHCLFANEFRKMYPGINLVVDKIMIDEGGIYSSGGAFSSMNLILYLIEKFAGREIAVVCSKIFQLDINKGSQSIFWIFKGQKDHEDEPVKMAQEYIESNFKDKITVDKLASHVSVGRRNLERRFKKATANTIVEYIQRVKVEAAKMSLESSRENVNEVMYKVGYSDHKAFRTVFKKVTGVSPILYRQKYNRNIASLVS